MGGEFASDLFHFDPADLKLGLLISCCLVLSLEAGGLLRALTQFSHLAADTIINGSATAHVAPTDHADRELWDFSVAPLLLLYISSLDYLHQNV